MEKFRGQFIAGRRLRTPEGFKTAELGPGYVFAHHPALPVAVQDGSLLAGLIFDPENPGFDVGDILRDILAEDVESTIAATSRLAGRWVLIYRHDGQEVVFHDACGTMPVMIFRPEGDCVVSSSTPLMAECVNGLEPDEFFHSDIFRNAAKEKDSGLGFPGTLTEYKNVRALLPNHACDMVARKTWRYYPKMRMPERSLRSAVPEIAHMLRQILLATRRYPLALGLTAGFDSRVLYGAMATTEDVRLFTFADPYDCPPGHYDIELAKRVAERADGRHETISALVSADADAMQASEMMRAPRYAHWVTACARDMPNRTVLSGWCSEVSRAFIRWPGSDAVSARQIADCDGYNSAPLAEYTAAEFASWFADASRVRDNTGINILDLFYWELRSRWFGSGFNILNTGCNWVSPCSCRALLDLMLSVPEKDRGGNRQRLYHALIRELDPALLEIPFNPKSAIKRFSARRQQGDPLSAWSDRQTGRHLRSPSRHEQALGRQAGLPPGRPTRRAIS